MTVFMTLLRLLTLGMFSNKITEIANNHQKQVENKNINPMFYVFIGLLSLAGLYWFFDVISTKALKFGFVNTSVTNIPAILLISISFLFTYLIYMGINKIQW